MNRDELIGGQIKGFIPTDMLPFTIEFAQRLAHTIRVFVQVFERHRLGANMSARKWVGVIISSV